MSEINIESIRLDTFAYILRNIQTFYGVYSAVLLIQIQIIQTVSGG